MMMNDKLMTMKIKPRPAKHAACGNEKSNDHIDYMYENNFITFMIVERTETEPESWVWTEEAPAP